MMRDRHVHVIDDDAAVRRSLALLLNVNGFSSDIWASGTIFLAKLSDIRPGCVLLDLRMPGNDGLEVQRTLNSHPVTLPVVVLTGHGDITAAVRAMRAGAVDFLEKPVDKSSLLNALEAAFERKHEVRSREAARATLVVLTERETDVLKGLTKGWPNKRIALELAISPRTVEIHRANIMSKLGARSLSHILRIAFAAGIDEN